MKPYILLNFDLVQLMYWQVLNQLPYEWDSVTESYFVDEQLATLTGLRVEKYVCNKTSNICWKVHFILFLMSVTSMQSDYLSLFSCFVNRQYKLSSDLHLTAMDTGMTQRIFSCESYLLKRKFVFLWQWTGGNHD